MSVITRACPHCPVENSSFTVTWNAHIPDGGGYQWNCAAVCGSCNKPISFQGRKKDHGGSAPKDHVGNIEPDYIVNQIWPSRVAHAAPPHTPGPVKARFLEGEDAYFRRRWNSAVAMYRSALDIATKGMEGVPSGTFFERLKWMAENHAITPEIKSWADHVRVEGNAALHDPEEFGQEDAKSLRFFTEMFLRYVFELPGEVKIFSAVKTPAPVSA